MMSSNIGAIALGLAACSVLAGCTAAQEDESSEAASQNDAAGTPSAQAVNDIDFGDDSSEWANDGECDDGRFIGPGMTETVLLDEDAGHDATDCRTAYEKGDIRLK